MSEAGLPAWVTCAKMIALAVPFVAYLGMLAYMAVGRPRLPRADAPTPELGTEPPAVVAMLMNRWRVGPEAAVATLLDLAARRYIDIADPGPGSGGPVVTVRRKADADLLDHERMLLDHVAANAPPGYATPVNALARRHRRERRAFRRRFGRAVRDYGDDRGLSTRILSETVESFFTMTAMGSAVNAAILLMIWQKDGLWWLIGPVAFIVGISVLMPLSHVPLTRGWSTPSGRAAARRWRGVRAFLDTTGIFADLPPAAVTVWDRYLAYAAAVGSARGATRALSAVWSGPRGPIAPAAPPVPVAVRNSPRAAPAAVRAAQAGAQTDRGRDRDARRLLDDVTGTTGVRIGVITVDGDEVRTPTGRLPRASAVWTVYEHKRTSYRFEPLGIALMILLMCMFPLNLLALFLAVEERKGGAFTVTVTAGGRSCTTTVPFIGDDGRNAVVRALTEVGARVEPAAGA